MAEHVAPWGDTFMHVIVLRRDSLPITCVVTGRMLALGSGMAIARWRTQELRPLDGAGTT